jgi:predicted DNA-binding transcriptional regulator YafY
MPTIDLTDDELAAVAAAVRRAVEEDRFPRAPRLDPLRSALAKLHPAAAAPLRRPQAAKSAMPAPQRPKTD